MKRLFVPFLALATLFFFGSSAYGQGHGRPPVTPSSTGGSSAHGSSASAEGGHASSNTTTSPSSPGSVLSNQHVSEALTNALAKSDITLPTGKTLADVCTKTGTSGFKTLGQCIAALHINHKFSGCSLTDLANAKSLGAAIQICNPQSDAKTAKTEAKTATKQANQEIRASSGS